MSPSLNVDTPVDMKIKSAMISDLMTLVGIPAVDPVLRRAQFNQKINNLTQVYLKKAHLSAHSCNLPMVRLHLLQE